MKHLADIPIFLEVADAGGFRSAADRLGMTSAGVSKAVARLEARLDTRLFERTTRRVDLTPQGAAYREKALAAMAVLDEGAHALDIARESPTGVVHLSLSPVLGPFLAARLPELAARVPGLGFDLNLSDEAVDLAAAGFDIALRVGGSGAMHLLTRRIAQLSWVTIAAPSYLARAGTPLVPADLVDHTCFGFRAPGGQVVPWEYQVEGTRHRHLPGAVLTADLGSLLVDAALSGNGIARVFRHMASQALESGRLVQVLADHEPQGPPVDALILPSVAQTSRVRVTLDFLYQAFRGFPA